MVPVNTRLSRMGILKSYARAGSGSNLVRCTPSPKATDRRSAGKFIFDSEEEAIAAAVALEQLGGRAMDFYVCHRSTRRQHMHLTTRKGPWKTPRLLNIRTVEGKV